MISNNFAPSFARTAPTQQQTPVDGSAFAAALGELGGEAPAARTAAPNANLLFQSMSPGLMMSPVSQTTSPIAREVAEIQSMRQSLYQKLGVEGPAGLSGSQAFMNFRGLESEGPTMDFSNAEMSLAS